MATMLTLKVTKTASDVVRIVVADPEHRCKPGAWRRTREGSISIITNRQRAY